MSKRILVIVVGIVVVIGAIVAGFFLLGNSTDTPMGIEQILNTKLDSVAYVKIGGAASQDMEYDLEQFLREYKNNKYLRFDGDTGNTTYTYFICYDKNNKVLLTVVDVGNRNLVYIKDGEFDINNSDNNLYQLVAE